eukprot:147579_1
MHVVSWLWQYLDTASRICIACCCVDFYGQVAEVWKDVVIPDCIPINDDNLMPILICAQNMRSLTINFPFDIEEEKDQEAMMEGFMQRHGDGQMMENETKKTKPIQFPSLAINPSYLQHLKDVEKIDFKSCGSGSCDSFICGFILQLPKFIKLKHLCLPHLFAIRHHGLETLDIHQLQIGFDGMNVHLGADLIGITHFKKQLPSINTIVCDELYLFIGEDIYANHQRSWAVMRKWCDDVKIKVFLRNPSLTIMLMPRDKKTPSLVHEKWENINAWLQDRLNGFISLAQTV